MSARTRLLYLSLSLVVSVSLPPPLMSPCEGPCATASNKLMLVLFVFMSNQIPQAKILTIHQILQEEVILYECSSLYNTSLMDKVLGDKYVHTSKICDSTDFGFPANRRRVYGVLIHRRVFLDGLSVTQSLGWATNKLDYLVSLFYRRRMATLEAFLIAKDEEIIEEVKWMQTRPKSLGKNFIPGYDEPCEFLTSFEKENVNQYYIKLKKMGFPPNTTVIQLNQSAKDF